MPGRSIDNRAQRNCSFEGREFSMVLHCKAEEIDVGNELVTPKEGCLK